MNVSAQPPSWPRSERTSDGVDYRVRPICRDDAQREREFIMGLSPESRFQRFMHAMREPSEQLVAHLVDIDAHSTMALVAVVGTPPTEHIIGVARYAADASTDTRACEFGVAVADAWQCRGIGSTLTRLLFEYAAREGYRSIYGHVLANNQRMIELAEWLGLEVEAPPLPGQSTLRASRRLD